jgi:AcrR family transcriptional regulator
VSRAVAVPKPEETSRRQAILSAALECFLNNSVSATTVDDLRERSEASVGSIYHHFGSKEGLAGQLYLEILRDYHEAYLSTLRQSRNARDGVMGSVRHHLRWVAAQPDRARYLFHYREHEVVRTSDGAVKALNANFYAEATVWLRAHVDAGRIKPLPPRLYQALWMGPTLEYARQWLASETRQSELLEAESALTRAAWDALRAVASDDDSRQAHRSSPRADPPRPRRRTSGTLSS